METNEHKQVGDQIRIETLDNPYLQGSKGLSQDKSNNLGITMMRTVNGIPVPLDLKLSAGDVVAIAGDYYTKAGWGKELELPKKTGHVIKDNEQLFTMPIQPKEVNAFREAYSDLASPKVKKQNIDHIYEIEEKTYIPFFTSLNALFQQLVYARTVEGYSDKLTNNEAHFALWSGRAYIVGHKSALYMANLAYYFKQLAEGNETNIPPDVNKELQDILAKINDTPSPNDYCFTDAQRASPEALCAELSARYHALAVGQDLFVMHFYSDHFAGGHMSRMGLLREIMPDRFGTWGSILINNMHNEDNTDSVKVTIPFQPLKEIPSEDVFKMPPEDCQAYGDGTYFKTGNDENSNLLINGMDNSLGDVARLMQTGEQREAQNYGGLEFLLEVDYTKPQPQPLLIHETDGKVYFRADVSRIKILSPQEYESTLQNPVNNGYKELTYFQAFVLVVKLRVLGFIYSPNVEKPATEVVAETKVTAMIEGTGSELHSKRTYAEKIGSIPPVVRNGTPGDYRKAPTASPEDTRSHTFFPPPEIIASEETTGYRPITQTAFN